MTQPGMQEALIRVPLMLCKIGCGCSCLESGHLNEKWRLEDQKCRVIFSKKESSRPGWAVRGPVLTLGTTSEGILEYHSPVRDATLPVLEQR